MNILALPGDCGSWVIDPTTGDIYGIIIATAPGAQESYVLPAYQVYDSIKSKLPPDTVVEFPTSNHILSVRTIYPTISPTGSMEPSMETMKDPRMGTLHDGQFVSGSSSEATGSEATNLSDEFAGSKEETESSDFLGSLQRSVKPPAGPPPRSRPHT